jgi:hypothetical protein
LGPEWFYQDSGTGSEAKEVCADCPVIVPCLDWAVRNGEQGIWGGVGPERRTLVRAALDTGNALAYHQALMEVVAELGRQLRGHEDERPELEPGTCGRCGCPRRGGRLPADRNGPGASCGLAATYNKGCRCDSCVDAKARWQKEAKARRKARRGSPHVGRR